MSQEAEVLVDAYKRAYEAVGGRMPQARRDGVAAVLAEVADQIDRGPTFPIPPSVISELVRERVADLRGAG